MIISPYPQGSLSWMMARVGVVTASEFDSILTPEFKIRTGEMPKTYLAKKVAEKWSGNPMPGFNVWDMDQGKILEEEAIPFYTLETGQDIQRVGLITTDNGKVGCSPDGLIGDDCGIEVKSPEMHTHVRYLLNGGLPKDYAPQVHGAMFVTGRSSWKFLSYRRRFPPLIVTVERDDEIQNMILEAVSGFLVDLEAAMKRLEEINGGPPIRRAPPTPEEAPKEEEADVIP